MVDYTSGGRHILFCPHDITRSKSCRGQSWKGTPQIRNVGASNGNVMLFASAKTRPIHFGCFTVHRMDCMPASIRITAKPTYFQLISNSSVQIAIFGSASQSGPLMPKLARISLMAPFF